jgi:hypothetical protein
MVGGDRGINDRGWDGYICEIICGTGTLDTDTRDRVSGYLAWKWGIEDKLPDDHTYKYIRPTR